MRRMAMLEYLGYINDSAMDSAATDAITAKARAANALSRTEEIGARIGAIELAIETLVRLGLDHKMFTEEQFLAMARSIDAEDGVLDGRRDLNRMKKMCGNCGKPNGAAKAKCMWCGADLTSEKPVPNEM
jgi:hypothetical protein